MRFIKGQDYYLSGNQFNGKTAGIHGVSQNDNDFLDKSFQMSLVVNFQTNIIYRNTFYAEKIVLPIGGRLKNKMLICSSSGHIFKLSHKRLAWGVMYFLSLKMALIL